MRTHAQRAADPRDAGPSPLRRRRRRPARRRRRARHDDHADAHHDDAGEHLGRHLAAEEASRQAHAATSAPVATPIAGDQIYCTTAQHFTTYEKTPPVIELLSKTLKGGTRAGVQMSLSKVSTVRLTVRQGSRTVWTNSAYVERGQPKLLWQTPASGGTFSVTLSATDPAGNFATTSGTIVVSKR